MKKIKIVGLGGIGSHLVEPLCCYLNHTHRLVELVLIDGDSYEEKNRQRQSFGTEYTNKAKATHERLSGKYPKIQFKVKKEYLTKDNIISLIREEDEVLLCVDNHATRKLVSDRCQELRNILLISGGNDISDGNVICYRKTNGKKIGRSLTEIDPKIANPEDKNPGEEETKKLSCEEEAEINPQLITANLSAASHMLNVYVGVDNNQFDYEQVYFDTLTHKARPTPEKQIELDF